MSPEQALGEPLTGASDVYALGIVLFEALTGTRYYGKADEIGILRQLAMKTPPVLPSSRAGIDSELEAIVVRALAPEPTARFSDGQVFFEALDGWLKTHPVATGAIESAMSAVFSEEVRTLGEVHRLASLTPASASNSMPHAPAALPPSRRTGLVLGALALFIGGAVMVGLVSARGVPKPALETALVTQPQPPPVAQPRPDEVDGGAVPTGATPLAAEPTAVAVVEPVDAGLEPPRGARAPVATTGRLTLDTEPWTGVFLGKRKLGDTPLIEFALPAGSHRLRLVNDEEHLDTVIEVTIKPRETTEKRLAF
jgi:serine/threonine-protein kinase